MAGRVIHTNRRMRERQAKGSGDHLDGLELGRASRETFKKSDGV